MSQSCAFNGNSDMYGLGIRLGYYLQWFGSVLAAWIAPGEVEGLRITNTLFVAATFLALLIQVGENQSPEQGGLQTVEVYIVLLLTFGSAFGLVPILLWRFGTGFDAEKDPTRWPKAKTQSATFNGLYTLLLIAVVAFQIWYWGEKVVEDGIPGCSSWGFLFSRISLQDPALRWLNVTLSVILLASLVALPIIRGFNYCFQCIDTSLEEGHPGETARSLTP
jgi:hypothetical protein